MDVFAKLTTIANEHVNTNASPKGKQLYDQACNVIANDLTCTNMESKMKCGVNNVLTEYTRGEACYQKLNLPLPSFEDVVGLGRALKTYDDCIAEHGEWNTNETPP